MGPVLLQFWWTLCVETAPLLFSFMSTPAMEVLRFDVSFISPIYDGSDTLCIM